MTIEKVCSFLDGEKLSKNAWSKYKPLLMVLCKDKTVLEVGAGRDPIFSQEEIKANNISYYANDISEHELSLLGNKYSSYLFDICGSVPEECAGKFDVVFSKMVQEHVNSGERFYSNIYTLLKSGGLAINFHPLVLSLPFFVNWILPEKISRRVLQALRKGRMDHEKPKFPATYEYCLANARTRAKIMKAGFAEVAQIPFYGHSYYQKIPVLNAVSGAFFKLMCKSNLKLFASFAYTVPLKSERRKVV